MKLHMKYFAHLREQLGRTGETIELDRPIDVAGLLAYLRGRGHVWLEALAPHQTTCVAVNQERVSHQHHIDTDAEVALFRPVTGG